MVGKKDLTTVGRAEKLKGKGLMVIPRCISTRQKEKKKTPG